MERAYHRQNLWRGLLQIFGLLSGWEANDAQISRALIQDYGRSHGMALAHEAAFLEIEPDRGSELIEPALLAAVNACRSHAAELLYVSFDGVAQWRAHYHMRDWPERASLPQTAIEAEPVILDGELFKPHAHFTAWRKRPQRWNAKKS
ncbi:MAG: hypothetical protein ACK439_00445 [Novosphingobium sp.]|jgi:hypothetical protein